jgi:hypothetical protein
MQMIAIESKIGSLTWASILIHTLMSFDLYNYWGSEMFRSSWTSAPEGGALKIKLMNERTSTMRGRQKGRKRKILLRGISSSRKEQI